MDRPRLVQETVETPSEERTALLRRQRGHALISFPHGVLVRKVLLERDRPVQFRIGCEIGDTEAPGTEHTDDLVLLDPVARRQGTGARLGHGSILLRRPCRAAPTPRQLQSILVSAIALTRRERENRDDVVGLQVRQILQDLLSRRPCRQEVQHVRDTDAQAADAGSSPADSRVGRDPLDLAHVTSFNTIGPAHSSSARRHCPHQARRPVHWHPPGPRTRRTTTTRRRVPRVDGRAVVERPGSSAVRRERVAVGDNSPSRLRRLMPERGARPQRYSPFHSASRNSPYGSTSTPPTRRRRGSRQTQR